MANTKPLIKLTPTVLKNLKAKGFQYVLIKGYDVCRRPDYIQLTHITLLPVKELPTAPDQKEIFAPIDSEELTEWAESSDNWPRVFIDPERPIL